MKFRDFAPFYGFRLMSAILRIPRLFRNRGKSSSRHMHVPACPNIISPSHSFVHPLLLAVHMLPPGDHSWYTSLLSYLDAANVHISIIFCGILFLITIMGLTYTNDWCLICVYEISVVEIIKWDRYFYDVICQIYFNTEEENKHFAAGAEYCGFNWNVVGNIFRTEGSQWINTTVRRRIRSILGQHQQWALRHIPREGRNTTGSDAIRCCLRGRCWFTEVEWYLFDPN